MVAKSPKITLASHRSGRVLDLWQVVFLIDAVRARDAPTVEAVALILVAVYIVANLASDIATTLLTPRLRTAAIG